MSRFLWFTVYIAEQMNVCRGYNGSVGENKSATRSAELPYRPTTVTPDSRLLNILI